MEGDMLIDKLLIRHILNWKFAAIEQVVPEAWGKAIPLSWLKQLYKNVNMELS